MHEVVYEKKMSELEINAKALEDIRRTTEKEFISCAKVSYLYKCKSWHYKSCFQGKSALQILFLMLRKCVMHLYEYDTFAMHNSL